MKRAVVYTDGSGVAPPGVAGIAYVAIRDGVRIERAERLKRASSQQAELLAAELALRELPVCDEVVVWSDSQYLVKGMTEWLSGWIRRGWRKSDGAPVLNRDQWELLLAARLRHGTVEFRWVRGRAGRRENERADYLAFRARVDGLSERYQQPTNAAFLTLRDER